MKAGLEPRSKHLGTVVLLALAIATGQLATTLYLPSLPDMSVDLGIHSVMASLTLTVYWAGFACANLIVGPLSDRRGRRAVLLGGLCVYIIGAVVCLAAPNIWILLAGRLLQSLGASAAPVVGRAVARDLFDGPELTRAMSWIAAAMAVAPALGPVLGGLIQETVGWRGSLLVLVLLGAAVLPLLWRNLKETLPPARRRHELNPAQVVRSYQNLLHDADYRKQIFIVSALFGAFGVYFAASPFLFISLLGMTPAAFGLLNLLNVGGYLIGSISAGKLGQKRGLSAIVFLGALITFAGGILMAVFSLAGFVTAWAIIAPMIVFGIGFGMVVPSGTSGALSRHPEQVGAASAFLGFLQVGACAMGTAIGGALPGETALPLSLVMAALAALACVAAARSRATERKTELKRIAAERAP